MARVLQGHELTTIESALGRAQEIFKMYLEIEQGDEDYMDFWHNESRLGGIARLEVETARKLVRRAGREN